MKRALLLIIVTVFCCQINFAQNELTQRWETMMAKAKEYAANKEYLKAIEQNEAAINDMESYGVDDLSATLKNSNAIYYIHWGELLLKTKKYKGAQELFEKAIANAKPSSKTMVMAHTYLGNTYSLQSLGIKQVEGDLIQAIDLCKKAEREYDLANATEKRLKEQLRRSDMLNSVMKREEAKALLQQVIKECEGVDTRNAIRGNALCDLGCIEQDMEDFQNAIIHLEKSYDILIVREKRFALLPAIRLAKLYKLNIPDAEKASLWHQKVEELSKE